MKSVSITLSRRAVILSGDWFANLRTRPIPLPGPTHNSMLLPKLGKGVSPRKSSSSRCEWQRVRTIMFPDPH
jgi:hypothetical protein